MKPLETGATVRINCDDFTTKGQAERRWVITRQRVQNSFRYCWWDDQSGEAATTVWFMASSAH